MKGQECQEFVYSNLLIKAHILRNAAAEICLVSAISNRK